ncbi:MAG: hypothetical protein ACRC56_02285 [Bosea sp. (in: a-proteobacteria)]
MTLISYLTRTQFADGAIEDALPEEARGLDRAVVLMDTEPGVQEALSRACDALPKLRIVTVVVSSDAPSRRTASELTETLRRADAATLITIGGPRSVAQARLVSEAAARRGVACPLITIPTALFDFGLSRHVQPLDGERVACPRPDRIIADPTLLAPAPPRRLAAAGIEMLVHAIEAYASPTFNPPADGLALDAVRRLMRWLPELAGKPITATLRRELMGAALTAGLAMEKGVGGVDALANPLEEALAGSVLPGELHAPVLAAIVDFNMLAVGDRYGALNDAMGVTGAEGGLATRLGALARLLGLPSALRETATDKSRFARVAELAADDPAALANPRLLTAGDCQQILEAAW